MSTRHSLDPGSRWPRQRLVIALVGLAILVASAWLALVVVSRIDALFFPGQGITGLPPLPGVQQDGAGLQDQLNILVMGLDRRPREGDAATRTDTMFVLTVDPLSKTAGILGIPRDLWVEIPFRTGGGFFEERVNTAYPNGEAMGYPGGGAALAKQVIEHNLGISIDRYVIIDFEGFIDLIDELGGIEVYVEKEVYDPFYSRTELPGDYHPVSFEVGLHHMDGPTALDYSRTRFGSSDLERIQRQQQVIFAAIDKALERKLVSIDSLTSLWSRYKGAIETDINDLQAPGYAALAAQIDPADISALSLAVATRPWTAPEGQSVLLVDKEMVQQLVQAIFSDRLLSEEAARVEVLNGAGTDGLATQVVQYLEGFGFPSDSLTAATTDDNVIRPLTEIIDVTGKKETVERLASLLDVAPERVRRAERDEVPFSTRADADVVVILGADAQARDFSVGASDG